MIIKNVEIDIWCIELSPKVQSMQARGSIEQRETAFTLPLWEELGKWVCGFVHSRLLIYFTFYRLFVRVLRLLFWLTSMLLRWWAGKCSILSMPSGMLRWLWLLWTLSGNDNIPDLTKIPSSSCTILSRRCQ